MSQQFDLFDDDDEESPQRYSSEVTVQGMEYHIEGIIAPNEFQEIVKELVENETRKCLLAPLK